MVKGSKIKRSNIKRSNNKRSNNKRSKIKRSNIKRRKTGGRSFTRKLLKLFRRNESLKREPAATTEEWQLYKKAASPIANPPPSGSYEKLKLGDNIRYNRASYDKLNRLNSGSYANDKTNSLDENVINRPPEPPAPRPEPVAPRPEPVARVGPARHNVSQKVIDYNTNLERIMSVSVKNKNR